MAGFNVLFTSSGRRVSLVRLFRKSFAREKIRARLVGVDLSPLAPTAQVADKFYLAPRVDAPDYIPRLLQICKKERIKLVVPLIDTELLIQARSREAFAQIGAFAMISAPETIELAMDKLKTSDFFQAQGCRAVRTYRLEDPRWKTELKFPLILKPARGSAGIGVHKVNDEAELRVLARGLPEPLVQEYIHGREYTCSIFIDLKGKVRTVLPRLRLEVRGGEVSKGMTVRNKKLIAFVRKAAAALPGAVGALNLQVFEDAHGEFRISELNPRFGGGFPLAYWAGADFPWWLYLMLNKRLERVKTDRWKAGVIMLRYDDEIIIKASPHQGRRIIAQSVK